MTMMENQYAMHLMLVFGGALIAFAGVMLGARIRRR